MATITFDTHQFIQTLEQGGVERAQAEAMAQAFRRGQEQMATRADIQALDGDFKVEITQLRTEIHEMEMRIENRLTQQDGEFKLVKWMLALVVAAEVVPLLAKLFN